MSPAGLVPAFEEPRRYLLGAGVGPGRAELCGEGLALGVRSSVGGVIGGQTTSCFYLNQFPLLLIIIKLYF